ncbi:hypothetical protein Ndes2526B_g09075 [Nannochloris sp. 'desiccata']
MALVGQTTSTPMPPQNKPHFEEGVNLLFQRWTALQLAVVNEWGGGNSKEKGQQLLDDVIHWFYTSKDQDQTDLEVFLDEALQTDFNVQAEDDSPYQIARSLVNMHHRVAQGDFSYLESLRQQQPASAAACQNADGAAAEDSSSSDEEGEGGSGSDDAMDAGGGEDMDMDDAPPVKSGPVIDEDGFQVVQRKGRGRK